jgi:hypothetical protein
MFRITSVTRIAIQSLQGETDTAPASFMSARPVTDRARISVSRVPRNDPLFREVATALLDAIGCLESELERLRNIIELKDRDITLQPELITIGGDGIFIPKRLNFTQGEPVQIFLELEQRSGLRLVAFPGEIDLVSDGTELKLPNISMDMRDFIVGYVFQQQGKERRRARNADSSD